MSLCASERDNASLHVFIVSSIFANVIVKCWVQIMKRSLMSQGLNFRHRINQSSVLTCFHNC